MLERAQVRIEDHGWHDIELVQATVEEAGMSLRAPTRQTP
jgi:hypothetical protein